MNLYLAIRIETFCVMISVRIEKEINIDKNNSPFRWGNLMFKPIYVDFLRNRNSVLDMIVE